MIITRSIRLVCQPRSFESICVEGTVSHDFGEHYDEATACATLQRVLDEAVRADVNEVVSCVPEDTPSFIDLWKAEVYSDNS